MNFYDKYPINFLFRSLYITPKEFNHFYCAFLTFSLKTSLIDPSIPIMTSRIYKRAKENKYKKSCGSDQGRHDYSSRICRGKKFHHELPQSFF